MGKMRKRLTLAKYAKKYKALREAVFGKKEEKEIVAEKPAPEPEVAAEAVETPVLEKPKPRKPRKPRKKTTTTAKKAATKKRTTKKKAAAAK